MNVLITGANGYLGSRLVKELADKHLVFALVRRSSLRNFPEEFSGRPVYVDELDDFVGSERVDAVINCAALYGRGDETFSELIDANIYFPQKILEVLSGRLKCFVNVGTSLPSDVSLYALSKNIFSQSLRMQSVLFPKTKIINLRLEHFYGAGDSSVKFSSFIFNSCLRGGAVDLTSGSQCRDFIHIEDVVSAIQVVVEKYDSLAEFEELDVGSGVAPTVREFVLLAKKVFSSDVQLNFGVRSQRKNEVQHSCADTRRLMGLGWVPRYTLEEGLKEVFLSSCEGQECQD